MHATALTRFFLLQEDADRQVRCKRHAARYRQDAAACGVAGDCASKTVGGIGLLGLGDAESALNSELFNHFAYQKGFVKEGASQWRQDHSSVHACDTIEPQAKARRQCSSFCAPSALGEHGIEQQLFESSKALLYNVNHNMKDLYASIRKNIGSNAKHPLLFIRMVLPNGKHESRAWIITRAVFKPRALDGLVLYPVNLAAPLEPPFQMRMELEDVTPQMHLPQFVCIDEIALEISVLRNLFPECRCEYWYNPCYYVCSSPSLTHLTVTGQPNWLPVGDLLFEPSDDEGGDDLELNEIDELIGSLPSFGEPSASATNKSSTTARSKNESKQKDAAGLWGTLSFLILAVGV